MIELDVKNEKQSLFLTGDKRQEELKINLEGSNLKYILGSNQNLFLEVPKEHKQMLIMVPDGNIYTSVEDLSRINSYVLVCKNLIMEQENLLLTNPDGVTFNLLKNYKDTIIYSAKDLFKGKDNIFYKDYYLGKADIMVILDSYGKEEKPKILQKKRG